MWENKNKSAINKKKRNKLVIKQLYLEKEKICFFILELCNDIILLGCSNWMKFLHLAVTNIRH